MAWRRQIFYNIERQVGPGKPNLTGDIVLVQFFLRRIGEVFFSDVNIAFPRGKGEEPGPLRPLSPVQVDGKVSEALWQWVAVIQEFSDIKFRFPLTRDGVIDPVPFIPSVNPGPMMRYTLGVLNAVFDLNFHDEYVDLASHEKTPQILKDALFPKVR